MSLIDVLVSDNHTSVVLLDENIQARQYIHDGIYGSLICHSIIHMIILFFWIQYSDKSLSIHTALSTELTVPLHHSSCDFLVINNSPVFKQNLH